MHHNLSFSKVIYDEKRKKYVNKVVEEIFRKHRNLKELGCGDRRMNSNHKDEFAN